MFEKSRHKRDKLTRRTNTSCPAAGHSYPRMIAGLGIGQICAWGSLYYSFPLIGEAMSVEFGYSKLQIYNAATIGMLLCGLAAYPVGALIDRGHGRALMFGGSFIAGALLIAWSQITNLVEFYCVFAAIGIVQAAILYEPAFAVAARRLGALEARNGIATITLFGGFASSIFVPLVQWLLDNWSWRYALVVLGMANVVSALIYLVVINPHADVAPATGWKGDGPASRPHQLFVVMRSPVFWLLMISRVSYALIFGVFVFHAYPMFLEKALSPYQVVIAIAVIGPAQILGRIVILTFARNASARLLGSSIIFGFLFVFIGLQFLPPTFMSIVAIATIYGLSNGIMMILWGIVVPEMLTTKSYGAINGALTTPANIARALAPAAAAYIWILTSSYQSVISAMMLAALTMAATFWLAAFLSVRNRIV